MSSMFAGTVDNKQGFSRFVKGSMNSNSDGLFLTGKPYFIDFSIEPLRIFPEEQNEEHLKCWKKKFF